MADAAKSAATGAATGGAVGSAVPFIGTAIGAAVGATLGALGVMKGKTPHLDYNMASTIAKQVAEKINAPIISTLGYNSSAYSNYGIDLAYEAWKKITANTNASSKSWQIWIAAAEKDLRDRANAKVGDPGSVIYVYALYVGMNYDASRPEEYGQVLGNDLTKMFQNLVAKYPQTQAMVYGTQAQAAAVTPAKKESETLLGKITGGGDSNSAPSAAPTNQTAGLNVAGSDGQKVVIAGFVILIIGFLLFTRKKK